MEKSHCSGCREDYYNYGGTSSSGECWSLKSAKLIMRKKVHINDAPPWNQKAQKFPNCYRKPQYVFVGPDQTC
jgi:hypothetical protein